jgi:F-box domain
MSRNRGLDALPDCLLPHILSYLPTKDAVRSSLISKRWVNLWAYLPNLDFNFAHFWSEDIFTRSTYTTHVSENSECHENFVRFIDGVLASRQIQWIDSFTLVWEYQVKNYINSGHPVSRWILLVLQQSPRVLSIYVQPSVSVDGPKMVFACSSLEEMKLQVKSRESLVLELALVELPRLRRLNLGYYTINGDLMEKLHLGCPNLEELELYTCGLNLSQISCGNLRSLVLDGCCNFTGIRVSIPTLKYLKVTVMSCQTAGIVLENMSSLVKACVCFLTAYEFERAFYGSEVKILSSLSRVKNLDIILHGSESVVIILQIIPIVFYELKEPLLDSCIFYFSVFTMVLLLYMNYEGYAGACSRRLPHLRESQGSAFRKF